LWSGDETVISSLAQNPSLGKGYTEKQRNLVLRLCKKYRAVLEAEFNLAATAALDNPECKFNIITVVPQDKSITIVDREIMVKFPYSEELVDKIRKFRDKSAVRLVNWNDEHRSWVFTLEENNILWIHNNLMPMGFKVDDQFIALAAEISEILVKIEDFVPMVKATSDGFEFANVHRSVPQPVGKSLKETLLLAKLYGITTWEETVDNLRKTEEISPIFSQFLNESAPLSLEFDVEENSIDQFTDLVKYNSPILIIVPGVNEFFIMKTWLAWLKTQNIAETDMSVLFRLPNDTGSMFNDLIKQNNLNQPLGDNTKVVFISQKLPKPLLKSNIEFKLILNLGSLSGVHYSLSNYLQDRSDVIRYTDKNKSGYQFGLL
jgi:hypothetical protein